MKEQYRFFRADMQANKREAFENGLNLILSGDNPKFLLEGAYSLETDEQAIYHYALRKPMTLDERTELQKLAMRTEVEYTRFIEFDDSIEADKKYLEAVKKRFGN